MVSIDGKAPGRDRVAAHELVDHTSEITVRLRASTFQELLAEAARAFCELIPAAYLSREAETLRDVRITGRDRTALLVGWLNEIVYLCDVDGWLPGDVESAHEEAEGLTLRARGAPLRTPFVLVKAATLHGASVREGPAGWEGEVTLDV
ncbi:MAG: archease [Gemmatimonadetes bacterium]|nr:archease [Gemmatimonadota bacterium]